MTGPEQESGQNAERRQLHDLTDLQPAGENVDKGHGGGVSWKILTDERLLVDFAIRLFHF